MTSYMDRNEAIEKAGEAAVTLVELKCCQPTGDNGETVEWSSDCRAGDKLLTCYYYTNEFDSELAAECGWDAVDWKIDHYTLEES
jgi:hypothetical protein